MKYDEKIEKSFTFTEKDVKDFLRISSDTNLIHTDINFAQQTGFKACIVPGLMTSSLIGGIIGSCFPGNGAVYLGQTLKFLSPIYVNEVIHVSLQVIKVRVDKPIITLHCEIQSSSTLCIIGEAVIKYREPS